jgi:uncharacterized membrane protein (UPF0182 family)
VKSQAKEFDYPSGDQNVYTTYGGQGGIPLEFFWHKALFAARLGDLKLLLSNDLTPGSRVLLYRNIRERVQRISPFFRYDDDPYMVISAARRIVWLLDGYTCLRPVPVLGADAWVGQLRAQRRQSERGRLRRNGAFLCRRSG